MLIRAILESFMVILPKYLYKEWAIKSNESIKLFLTFYAQKHCPRYFLMKRNFHNKLRSFPFIFPIFILWCSQKDISHL